jgi:hypothetical protein
LVRTLAGETLGYGELVQQPTRSLVTSRLLLHFTDGSLYDETVTFSQKDVFRLESYRLVHRGPSFPKADIAFDRKSGQYRVRQQDKQDSEEKTASGPLVGDSLDTFKLVSGDAHFTLTVAGVAYAVTVPLASTVLPTANTTIDQLVADVNAALLVALPPTLDGKIVAAKSGTALVLRIAYGFERAVPPRFPAVPMPLSRGCGDSREERLHVESRISPESAM